MTERWTADTAHIRETVERLRSGAVVAFPTDTLYAVAARAADPAAVDRFYRSKRRPSTQPAILLVDSRLRVEPLAIVHERAAELMRRYWPGPLTLVLAAKAGGDTVAVRAPNHPVALRLLSELAEAVVSSSANRAGGPPPVDAEGVIEGLGDDVDVVLDGGRCAIGVASTILDLSVEEPRILRDGAIPASELLQRIKG
jgi:L-threonylcarbamoyladenylate synthase